MHSFTYGSSIFNYTSLFNKLHQIVFVSRFETSDGTQREERGEISNPESDNAILRVQGSYSYITPEGTIITVRYIADDQGYKPQTRQSAAQEDFVPGDRVGTPVITTLQAGNQIG